MNTSESLGNLQLASDSSEALSASRKATFFPDATKRNVPITDVEKEYGATDLRSAITSFLTNRLDIPEHDVMLSRHHRLDVWHRLYLHHQPLPFAPFEPPRRDVVRASPPTLGPRGREKTPGVWDTALYLERPNRFDNSGLDDNDKHGIQRYRARRVHGFFKLPGHLRSYHGGQLAYLEVFDAFDSAPSSFSRMHSTKPAFDSRNCRRTIVIPITEIVMACHLAPKFHQTESEVKLNCHTDALAVFEMLDMTSTSHPHNLNHSDTHACMWTPAATKVLWHLRASQVARSIKTSSVVTT
ncbi:hypothetical protein BDV93DRAFT_563412 [Ceratobasidium sp. AG-I]|nr:hypothetical protein BDV93DRAFT_563412 [Ceratobasidium sp. AG-I]